MENEYLSSAVGAPLTQCLAELASVMPRDPIEWIAHWLYRFMDNEIYFYEKSIYLKDSHRMQLEVDKQRELRRSRLTLLNSEMKGIKEEMGDDMKSISMIYMQKLEERRKSEKYKFGGGGGGGSGGSIDEDEADWRKWDRGSDRYSRQLQAYIHRHPSKLGDLRPSEQELLRQSARRTGSRQSQRSFTADWQLDCNLGLICDHPLLGSMRGRPPFIPPETPEWWQRRGYLEQTLYDHEVYSAEMLEPVKTNAGECSFSYRDLVHKGSWLQEGNLRGMNGSLQDMYRMAP